MQSYGLQVKADIQLIKQDILSSISNGEPIDYDNVKRLFEKAENNIQVSEIVRSVQHS